MKKTFILLVLATLFSFAGRAQEPPLYLQEYGRVGVSELNETRYPYDADAEAAVLYEIGDYRFRHYERGNSKGFELVMTISTKIKIYNEAGLEYASIEIPYYRPSDEPEIVTVKGTTYNMDGEIITRTELTKANIYDEKVRDDFYVKKIAFPDVRAGSVIDLQYEIRTQHYFNMRTWQFQKKIPVYYSSLTYRAMPFYEYSFIAKGLTKFDEYKSTPLSPEHQFGKHTYREVEYQYAMKQMPAFRDEEFLRNIDDYMANLNFQLSKYYSHMSGTMVNVITTWPELHRKLVKDADFGKYVDASAKEAKNILPLLGIDGKTDLEKFKLISDYVKSKYVWNKRLSKYAFEKPANLLKNKTGNSAELNLFMTGLMRAAGLDADPVILSTRENGNIYKDYPFLHSFNNVVTMATIDGDVYFADASVALTRYDELPSWCTNLEGLAIGRKEHVWVSLGQNEEASDAKEVKMTILPSEGKISAAMTQTLRGDDAYTMRSTYNGDIEKLKDRYKGNEGMTILDMDVRNFQETDEPLLIDTRYELITGAAGEEPAQIIISPLAHLAPESTPFKQAVRTHPVDLIHSSVKTYRVEIDIPEGYVIDYLPEAYGRNNAIMQISYKPVVEGNKIILTAGYAMKDLYMPNEYAGLKQMYENMVRTLSEVIILKKQ